MQREQLQTILLEQQQQLTERRDKIYTDLQRRQISKDFSQQAIERENDDVLGALKQEAEQELAQINEALERLNSDNFDQCVSCSDPISDERLTALPYTKYCRHCAQKLQA